jgi:hypothetical protein
MSLQRARRAVGRRLRRAADRTRPHDPLSGFDPVDRAIAQRALPYTMTTPERIQGLIDAVRYVVGRGIPGSFVECGVWRGGSVVAMIGTLQELDAGGRDIYLFDTFEGMTEPTASDVSASDGSALDAWRNAQSRDERPWPEVFGPDAFDVHSVEATVRSTGYPADRLHLVQGAVEETLPDAAPEDIALLRLDTDWYESTRHELIHLFPRLRDGGVLIIDDYGHWEGARRAVDEYFAEHAPPVLLSRLDYTGRIAIKH